MKTSQKGIDLIKQSEGYQSRKYMDASGYPTIGYGTKIDTEAEKWLMTASISEEQADELLRNDLIQFEKGLSAMVKVPINQNQFDALIDFVYNLGLGNLKKSTLLAKLNSGDYSGAQAEFIRWNKAKGQVLAGLTRRRQAEADLFGSTN